MEKPPNCGRGSLRLRPASARDAPALSAVGWEAWAQAFGASMAPGEVAAILARRKSPAYFRGAIARGGAFILAERGCAPIGYASLVPARRALEVVGGRRPTARDLVLDGLYVRPCAQGAGLGRVLLAAALASEACARAECVYLSVWEENPRAAALYRAAGFVPVGAAPVRAGGRIVGWDAVMARHPRS